MGGNDGAAFPFGSDPAQEAWTAFENRFGSPTVKMVLRDADPLATFTADDGGISVEWADAGSVQVK